MVRDGGTDERRRKGKEERLRGEGGRKGAVWGWRLVPA